MAAPTLFDTTQTITVASGESVSAAIDLGGGGSSSATPGSGYPLGFICPAAIEATTARLSFLSSATLAGTYTAVKRGGTAVTLTFAVNDYGLMTNPSDLWGVRFLKIVCETAAGVAVAQATAARVFTVIKANI
jgi:hypothetical protein